MDSHPCDNNHCELAGAHPNHAAGRVGLVVRHAARRPQGGPGGAVPLQLREDAVENVGGRPPTRRRSTSPRKWFGGSFSKKEARTRAPCVWLYTGRGRKAGGVGSLLRGTYTRLIYTPVQLVGERFGLVGRARAQDEELLAGDEDRSVVAEVRHGGRPGAPFYLVRGRRRRSVSTERARKIEAGRVVRIYFSGCAFLLRLN